MARQYKIISADSHLDVSPNRWTSHVPAKWRERAPRTIKLENGNEGVIVEGRPLQKVTNSILMGGLPRDQWHQQIPSWDSAPGAGSPEQRLREQDQDGVDAEVLYNFSQPHLWRGIKDDAVYAGMIHAYNEWLAEEYCPVAPDRLLAMGTIPPTNLDDAMAELEYCAKAGLKGVQILKFPSGKSAPRPEDDRFWAAALDLNMPITSHSSRFGSPDDPELQTSVIESNVGGPKTFFRFAMDTPYAAMQMAFDGLFDRFPNLQIYWGETNVGWLPFTLMQLDANYERYRLLNQNTLGAEPLERMPSDYLKDNCYFGFLDDTYGVQSRAPGTVEKIMWSSDFPHGATNWPHSRESIEQVFAGVPQEEKDLMLVGNAVRFFHLEQ